MEARGSGERGPAVAAGRWRYKLPSWRKQGVYRGRAHSTSSASRQNPLKSTAQLPLTSGGFGWSLVPLVIIDS